MVCGYVLLSNQSEIVFEFVVIAETDFLKMLMGNPQSDTDSYMTNNKRC